jgi:hypothetical protein
MGTRSYIGLVREDDNNAVWYVYCHFDSYRNLNILKTNYNTFEKVDELISHGDMESLKETIVSTPFYGEEESHPRRADSIDEFLEKSDDDYTFLFKDGDWHWRQWSHPLNSESKIEPKVKVDGLSELREKWERELTVLCEIPDCHDCFLVVLRTEKTWFLHRYFIIAETWHISVDVTSHDVGDIFPALMNHKFIQAIPGAS